jgi:hypothetical protein
MESGGIRTQASTVPSPPLPQPELPSLADADSHISASPEELRQYLPYLDGTNLSEPQRIALLQTIWSIMSVFVGLAFGKDPTQQVLPPAASELDREDAAARQDNERSGR